jgi:hypothetical protein
MLVNMESGNAHIEITVANAQSPVGLTEEVVGFLHTLFQTKEHGAVDSFLGIQFVLDQGVSLVVAAVFIVVVVEPLMFQAYLTGNSRSKPREVPRVEVGIEGYG